ncbi:MAG: hypothetical protein AB7T63_13555 [Planctomycetota bacterium]
MPAVHVLASAAGMAWALAALFALLAVLHIFRADWVWRWHAYRMRCDGIMHVERTDAWERRNALHGIWLVFCAVITAGAAVAIDRQFGDRSMPTPAARPRIDFTPDALRIEDR